MNLKLKDIWSLIRRTFSQWREDKAPRLAAALSYYTSFSLAPILVIAISVAGAFYTRSAVQDLIVNQIGNLAGSEGERLIRSMLDATKNLGSGLVPTIFGVVVLIFAATGVFGQLQDALNTMWEVQPRPGRGVLSLIKDRFFSFTLVVGVGFLLLVSLVISAALSAFSSWTLGLFPDFEVIIQILNQVISFLVIMVVFAFVFKYVPDAEIEWRDVWLGAAVTAALFMIGKFAIGLYIGNSNVAGTFGAASALVVILIWVYYSAQISFLGAEFTQVYANTYGSRVVPEKDAVAVSEQVRAEQGISHKESVKDVPRQGPVFIRQPDQVDARSLQNVERSVPPEAESSVQLSFNALSSLLTGLAGLLAGYVLLSRRKPKSRKIAEQNTRNIE
jgi:membrane protein